jgi:glycosyltransferase involved in cell wall biosynthesis
MPGWMQPLDILFTAPYVPSHLRVRPYNLIKQLSALGHRITVIAASACPHEHTDESDLRACCERVDIVRVPRFRSFWSCARALPRGLPLQAVYAVSPALQRMLHSELSGSGGRQRHDVLHVEHMRAALLGCTHANGIVRIYDAVDCMARLCENAARSAATRVSRVTARLDLSRTRRFEAGLMMRFDRILTVTSHEKEALAGLATPRAESGADCTQECLADRITVLSNGVDLDYFTPPDDTPRDAATLLYVGRMGYHANTAAAVHLIEAVMPRVWRVRPQARLVIVGPDPPARIRRLARRLHPRVLVTGQVADVRPWLARATVSVAPMVYAAGIQNKVLEALAMRTPVVASPVACAALGVQHREHVLLADDPAAFADCVLQLCADPALQAHLGVRGRQYAERWHDWRSLACQLETVYLEELAKRRGGMARRAVRRI